MNIRTGMLVASVIAAWPLAGRAVTDAQLFAYAEANYPGIFAGSGVAGNYQNYRYQYYPGSGNFLGIDDSGMVFLLGPFTANKLTALSSVNAFAGVIANWEASAPGLYKLVDTNQSLCYASASGQSTACTGRGQDADHAGNAPGYSLDASGKMVTDQQTGLIWLRSTDTNADGLVNYADKKTPAEAASYCSRLELGGHAWRLPSIRELYSLIEFSGKDASSYTENSTSGLTPFIDPVFDWAFGDQAAGDRIIDAQYATSTNYVSTTMGNTPTMFGVNFVVRPE